jgi:diaminohydroxyphosphoribosylaminopyrimidine deaminase/5-amino-6-(5-phosphoribosylamino)uracil reductase
MLSFFIMVSTEEKLMRRALQLALKGRGRTSPNPMVGSLLLKKGKIIAQGYHERAGEPHAEAIVLKKAGEKARGGTLFITLEPCCHTDKRTPPCSKAIIQSGVKKVIVAMEDPNPRVSGKGIAELRAAGIEVKSGILEEKAKKLNEAYIKHIRTRLPFVTLKIAMSLDGKIATRTGDSKWITGEKARALVHRMRSDSDAILTGVGTVLADDPELTARIKGGKDPVRIVIDRELKTPLGSKIFKTPPETIIVSEKHLPPELVSSGVKNIPFQGCLSLKWLMESLGRMGITSVLIEAGSTLSGAALDEGIVDKVAFFIAPKIIGGKEAFPAVGGKGVEKIKNAYRVKDLEVRKIYEDFLIEGYL